MNNTKCGPGKAVISQETGRVVALATDIAVAMGINPAVLTLGVQRGNIRREGRFLDVDDAGRYIASRGPVGRPPKQKQQPAEEIQP